MTKLQDLKLCAEQGCDEVYNIKEEFCPSCLSSQSIPFSRLGFGMHEVSITTLEIVDSFHPDLVKTLETESLSYF